VRAGEDLGEVRDVDLQVESRRLEGPVPEELLDLRTSAP
jgi:hypothetical protein